MKINNKTKTKTVIIGARGKESLTPNKREKSTLVNTENPKKMDEKSERTTK